MVDLNATQAAIRAGYSKKTARKIANENLTKPDIAQRIWESKKDLQETTGVTARMVIDELKKIGFSNIQDFIGKDNEIKDLSQLERELVAPVESIAVDIRHDNGESEGYTEKVKFKLYDKLRALADLGKHLGIFEKDNRQKAETLAEFLKAMRDD